MMDRLKKKTIPRYNSVAFTYEKHDIDLSIVTRYHDRTNDDAIEKYCLGWTYSDRTAFPDNGKRIALMFEDEDGEMTWFHYYVSIIGRDYLLEGYKP